MKFRVLGYNIQQTQTMVDIHILGEAAENPGHHLVVLLADHEPLTLNGLKLAVELGLQKIQQRRDNLSVVELAYRESWVLDTEELEDQSGCPGCIDGECQCGGQKAESCPECGGDEETGHQRFCTVARVSRLGGDSEQAS